MAVRLYSTNIDATYALPQRFERKYYLVPEKIGLAYGLLRQICLEGIQYPSEQINSLYFDTINLDQHERSSSGDFKKDKVRIRWYGKDNDMHGMKPVFLELKSRQGFASTKQRLKLLVPAANLSLSNLGKGIVSRTMLMNTMAKFGNFLPEMIHPIIKISYWRYRFRDILTGQYVSLDCNIRSTMIIPGLGKGEKELKLPGAIIEIKGQAIEIPETLRQMAMLEINWSRFSKYSTCINSHIER